MITELTKDNLQEEISNKELAVVFFMASWYGSCILLKKKFLELAEQYPEFSFISVDITKNPKSADWVDVKKIPSFAIYSKGKRITLIATPVITPIQRFLEEYNIPQSKDMQGKNDILQSQLPISKRIMDTRLQIKSLMA